VATLEAKSKAKDSQIYARNAFYSGT